MRAAYTTVVVNIAHTDRNVFWQIGLGCGTFWDGNPSALQSAHRMLRLWKFIFLTSLHIMLSAGVDDF
jgi:hypothetical protein